MTALSYFVRVSALMNIYLKFVLQMLQMVYLGDTRDASNVVEMARDCDLLVHEVTGPEPRKDLLKRKVRHASSIVCIFRALHL
jgi:ribonuclease BN (tRNA processing enzyme)